MGANGNRVTLIAAPYPTGPNGAIIILMDNGRVAVVSMRSP